MYLMQILGLNPFGRSRPLLSMYDHRPSEKPPAKKPRAGADPNASPSIPNIPRPRSAPPFSPARHYRIHPEHHIQLQHEKKSASAAAQLQHQLQHEINSKSAQPATAAAAAAAAATLNFTD